MNRFQVLKALINGEKITHPNWAETEFITLDRLGFILNQNNQWFDLNSMRADAQYKIYTLPESPPTHKQTLQSFSEELHTIQSITINLLRRIEHAQKDE